MASNKTERILNLFFLLLNSRRPISRHEIRTKIEDYRNSENDVSFERMFERDKDVLRQIGVKIETKAIDKLFDDDLGYLIDKQIFSSVDIKWDEDELSILSLIRRIWEDTQYKQQAQQTLLKTGHRDSNKRISDFDINIFDVKKREIIVKALEEECTIEFDYISRGEKESKKTRILPLGIKNIFKVTYIEGLDINDGTRKNFNFYRILDVPTLSKKFANIEIDQKIDNQKSKKIRIKFNTNANDVVSFFGGEVEDENCIMVSYSSINSILSHLVAHSSLISEIFDVDLKKSYLDKLKSLRVLI